MDPWGYSMLLMGSLGQSLLNFLFSPNDLGSGTTPVYRLSASRESLVVQRLLESFVLVLAGTTSLRALRSVS